MDALEAHLDHLVVGDFFRPLFSQHVHQGFLWLAAQNQTGRVGLGVAAVDKDLLAVEVGHGRGRVLGGGRLADAALAVDCDLSHASISWVCCAIGEKVRVTHAGRLKARDVPDAPRTVHSQPRRGGGPDATGRRQRTCTHANTRRGPLFRNVPPCGGGAVRGGDHDGTQALRAAPAMRRPGVGREGQRRVTRLNEVA